MVKLDSPKAARSEGSRRATAGHSFDVISSLQDRRWTIPSRTRIRKNASGSSGYLAFSYSSYAWWNVSQEHSKDPESMVGREIGHLREHTERMRKVDAAVEEDPPCLTSKAYCKLHRRSI